MLLSCPFGLLLRSVVFGLVGRPGKFFSLFAGDLGIFELLLFLSLSGSLLFGLDLRGVLLLLVASGFAFAGLDLAWALGHGRLLLVALVLLVFLVLGNVCWVVSARVAIVSADLGHVGRANIRRGTTILRSTALICHLLLVEGEEDNLNLLLGDGVTDEFDGELLIWPVLTLQAVEDSTCIAIVFCQPLGEHSLQQLLGQVLELPGVELLLVRILALLLLLLLLVLSDRLLKLDVLVLEDLGRLVAHRVASLLPEVHELVESDQASLVLLRQEVGCSGAPGGLRSDQNHVELLLFLESGRHLYLELVSEHLCEFRLEISLLRGEVVARLGDFLLGLLRLDQLRPVLAVLVLGVLLAMLLGCIVFNDLLLVLIVLLHFLLSLLDLALQALDLTLVLVLRANSWPEFAAWTPQGEE